MSNIRCNRCHKLLATPWCPECDRPSSQLRAGIEDRDERIAALESQLAEANARADDTSKLLSAVMDEITRVAELALGYKQICSAPQAVRRLAQRYQEAKNNRRQR